MYEKYTHCKMLSYQFCLSFCNYNQEHNLSFQKKVPIFLCLYIFIVSMYILIIYINICNILNLQVSFLSVLNILTMSHQPIYIILTCMERKMKK